MIVIIKVGNEHFMATTALSEKEILNNVIEYCPFPAELVSTYFLDDEKLALQLIRSLHQKDHKHGHWYSFSAQTLANIQRTFQELQDANSPQAEVMEFHRKRQ